MIHLPRTYDKLDHYTEIIDYALGEAGKLVDTGFDGFIVENYNDYPFPKKDIEESTLVIIQRVLESLRASFKNSLIGLNILRNNALASARLACRESADFIRVNAYLEPVWAPEGLLEPVGYEVYRFKEKSNCGVKIYADVNVKHSKPILDYVTALKNLIWRGRVDGVIVSGSATGSETSPLHVYLARRIAPENIEVIVGSGVTLNNTGLYVGVADALIIGTWIKEGGITTNPIDPERARMIVDRVKWLEKIRGLS